MTALRNTSALRLLVRGAVQGVGFRPFVFREAVHQRLRGWVRNTAAGVEIVVHGPSDLVTAFPDTIRRLAPNPARVDGIETETFAFDTAPADFRILESSSDGEKRASIVPDLATCPACLAELRDPGNRRFRYPFTNCTACGPRYSIMHRLPYDRARTTMHGFRQCPECRQEFDDPSDRRFHAQPNACPVCGPQLVLWDRQGRPIAGKHDAILEAVHCLRNGGIVAVKGIGGFHLFADATRDDSVRLLRERKHREEKPFAVMVPSLDAAAKLADIAPAEAEWLASPAAPIVLLRRHPDAALSAHVAPGNPCLGLFLPYTPLHHLLMDEWRGPLIATSGNVSDEPICTDEYEALERLDGIADFFLVHNRPIAHPVDDSVLRIVRGQPLLIRRARGFAPLELRVPFLDLRDTVLATGAHMKATFAIARGDRIVLSPHIGDLETVPAWQAYERNLETLQELYEVKPERAACDLHPDYASTRHAHRHFRDVTTVQHHHAHILAVMAEHGIDEPVIGLAWDGTGYGTDGTIWGGEGLCVDRDGFTRAAFLRPFPLPGGDAAAREPRRSAFGLLHEMRAARGEARPHPDHPFTATEEAVLARAIERGLNTVRTSSMGRLFDAVASLLGLGQVSAHEGQAAMLVQAEAERCDHSVAPYPARLVPGPAAQLDWEPLIDGLMSDYAAGVAVPVIARRFHHTLAEWAALIAARHPGLPVVLSGGCFQNALLLALVIDRLEADGRRVKWPRQLPPNDGAIAVGQVVAAAWRKRA